MNFHARSEVLADHSLNESGKTAGIHLANKIFLHSNKINEL